LHAPAPADGFRHVYSNTKTALVTESYLKQCCRMCLDGSKLVPPQRFSVVSSNTTAMVVHDAQLELCAIKALRCSQPIQRQVSGNWLHKASHRFPPHTNLQIFHLALRDGSLQGEICMTNECLTPLSP
jgi:hypothetical protein